MLCTFSYARLKLNPARVYFRMKTFHVNSIYLAFTFLMNLVFIQLSVDQIFHALHISCCSSLCVLALSVQLLTFTFFYLFSARYLRGRQLRFQLRFVFALAAKRVKI